MIVITRKPRGATTIFMLCVRTQSGIGEQLECFIKLNNTSTNDHVLLRQVSSCWCILDSAMSAGRAAPCAPPRDSSTWSNDKMLWPGCVSGLACRTTVPHARTVSEAMRGRVVQVPMQQRSDSGRRSQNLSAHRTHQIQENWPRTSVQDWRGFLARFFYSSC